MFKEIDPGYGKAFAAVCALALALSGCAAGQNLTNSIATSTKSAAADINALAALANDPGVQAAAASVRAFGTAAICYASDGSVLVNMVASSAGGAVAAQAAKGSQKVYVSTSALCLKFGGTVAVTL